VLQIEERFLIGTWRLISFSLTETGSEKIIYPYGKEVTGTLFITSDRHFAVFISSKNRARFASNDIMAGTEEEKIKAVESFSSYCGRYDIELDALLFHPEVSLFPNWIGVDQKRFVTLRGENEMELSSRNFINVIHRVSHSIWIRN
jgi:hypothetical protein